MCMHESTKSVYEYKLTVTDSLKLPDTPTFHLVPLLCLLGQSKV